jgi:hypothetical protein
MRADFEVYVSKIDVTLCIIAYRSAFRLGLPGQCNSTHLLDMKFVWSPEPEHVCQRFQLNFAEVIPFANANYSLPDEFVRTRTSKEEKKQGGSFVTTRMVAFRQSDLATPGAPPSLFLRRCSMIHAAVRS